VISCQSGVSMRRSLRRTLAIHSAVNQCSTFNAVPVQGGIWMIFFIISIYVNVKRFYTNMGWHYKAT
jgi:hypothetical protein